MLIFFAEFMISRFFWIVPMLVTVLAFVWLILYSNKSIGIQFSTHIWPAIKDNPNAVSNWHGKRLIALSIVCAGASIAGAIVSQI